MILPRRAMAVVACLALGGCYYVDFLFGDIDYPTQWRPLEHGAAGACPDLTGIYRDDADVAIYNDGTKPDKPYERGGVRLYFFFDSVEMQRIDRELYSSGKPVARDAMRVEVVGPREGMLHARLLYGSESLLTGEFSLSKNMACDRGAIKLRYDGEEMTVYRNSTGLVTEGYSWVCMLPLKIGCTKYGGWYQWPRLGKDNTWIPDKSPRG